MQNRQENKIIFRGLDNTTEMQIEWITGEKSRHGNREEKGMKGNIIKRHAWRDTFVSTGAWESYI